MMRSREGASDFETITISDNSPDGWGYGPRRNESGEERSLTPASFSSLLPRRPYCTNNPRDGIAVRKREQAIAFRHIQFNRPFSFDWLLFDVDRRGAELACREAILPQANLTMANPENGHAHIGFLLKFPVLNFAGSRSSPLHFYAAVERGIRRRLEADPGYSALVVKNPLHQSWRVIWGPSASYTLGDLESWLFEADTRPEPTVAEITGTGRNCTIFDDVRGVAYGEILKFKRAGGTLEAWRARCEALARGSNRQFQRPLPYSEVRSISKSIARWTWRRFSDAALSERQSILGKRGMASRWAGHLSAEETQPWKQDGISRATWYRRKAQCVQGQGMKDME
jgi:Replicase family/Primase C terminal 1 (PriCT-1)